MSLEKLNELRDEYAAPMQSPPKLPMLEKAAAKLLLEAAFVGTEGLAPAARRGGVAITIVAPDASWVAPMESVVEDALNGFAWREVSTVGALPCALTYPDVTELDGEDDFPAGSTVDVVEDPRFPDLDAPDHQITSIWSVATRDGTPRSPTIDHLETMAANQLMRGTGVIILAASEADLPPRLTAAADFRLVVPALTGAILTEAMAQLARRPARTLSDALCALLSAADLKLAARPATSPDDWVNRLERMAKARVRLPASPRLEDLHGMDEAKEWGEALRRDVAAYRAGTLSWHEMDKGLLLAGPPGVGKTQFASALAASCGLPLITASYGEWQAAGHQGDMLRAMASTFAEAKRAAPCLFFIDELDSFTARHSERPGQNQSYNRQITNAMLEHVGGLHGRQGVIMLGACNYPALLDPALIRAGRFDRLVHIPLPDRAALAGILRYHLGPDHLPGLDLTRFAARMEGASGADCELLARTAKRRARLAGRPMVAADLEAELHPADRRTPALRQLCAVHEAGHAVAAAVLRPSMLISASIRISAGGLGGVNYRMDGEVLRRNDLLDLIQVHLAGRAAEELLLGAPSTGAGGNGDSDLALATVLATQMLTSHGLGDHLTWLGPVTTDTVPRLLSSNPQIAAQVATILDTQYAKVRVLLYAWYGAVQNVAGLLLARETASAAEIIAITNATLHEARTQTLQ
ncbi:AAA family ATPase [Nitrospirillum viridazoti]|nr:AAA family ATPase [Nitrospirillum amazonense]TWB25984.1 ATP-dependent Zn protease [Nitrospirillum amazonense]